jgi:hypothetical protein
LGFVSVCSYIEDTKKSQFDASDFEFFLRKKEL